MAASSFLYRLDFSPHTTFRADSAEAALTKAKQLQPKATIYSLEYWTGTTWLYLEPAK